MQPIQELQVWIADNLSRRDLSTSALADRVSMRVRNFGRVFTADVGTTPAKYAPAAPVIVARSAPHRDGRRVRQRGRHAPGVRARPRQVTTRNAFTVSPHHVARRISSATILLRPWTSAELGSLRADSHASSSTSPGSSATERQRVPRKLPSGSNRPPTLSC